MSLINSISTQMYSNYQGTNSVKKEKDTEKTTQSSNSTSKTENATQAESTSSSASSANEGVIYESTTDKSDYKTQNAALIAQLKADSDNRVAQLQSLVEKMFAKQGVTIGNADNMWKLLAKGNFTADADTIAQAKEDISEDGYWGVKQTSERIFSFAKALSGGDKETMEKMRSAFEKGFSEATKSWGSSLPAISQQTYDAVEKMFDDYASSFEE